MISAYQLDPLPQIQTTIPISYPSLEETNINIQQNQNKPGYPPMGAAPEQNLISKTPELEVRDVQEPGPDDTVVTKRYVVHKVRPLSETLFQISYHYKVPIKEI